MEKISLKMIISLDYEIFSIEFIISVTFLLSLFIFDPEHLDGSYGLLGAQNFFDREFVH